MYLYATEIGAGRWDRVAAGLALWLADWINEILNSFVLQFTGVHALWIETGPTAFQLLVGLNIETSMLFLVFGLVYARLLPADRSARGSRGMNARWFWALQLSRVRRRHRDRAQRLGPPELALVVLGRAVGPAVDLRVRLPVVLPGRGTRARCADARGSAGGSSERWPRHRSWHWARSAQRSAGSERACRTPLSSAAAGSAASSASSMLPPESVTGHGAVAQASACRTSTAGERHRAARFDDQLERARREADRVAHLVVGHGEAARAAVAG